MKLDLKISHSELEVISSFVLSKQDTPLYIERLNNINNKERYTPNKDIIWKRMVECLLSTRQKVSPGMPVYRFSETTPFQLNYQKCKDVKDINQFVLKTLKDFGGIIRINEIAKAININLEFWENNNGWKNIYEAISELKNATNKEQERVCVERFMGNENGFHQFGPKQCRNFFQMLGLVKYEIPIDSRTIKWLNENKFPLKISGSALGDRKLYNFILDIIQEICDKIDIYPTLFDAAVFTSFDKTVSTDLKNKS